MPFGPPPWRESPWGSHAVRTETDVPPSLRPDCPRPGATPTTQSRLPFQTKLLPPLPDAHLQRSRYGIPSRLEPSPPPLLVPGLGITHRFQEFTWPAIRRKVESFESLVIPC